ncbi:MAG: outer membrane lipoprotein carrier protein LolA [Paracoccaceae bacterium]
MNRRAFALAALFAAFAAPALAGVIPLAELSRYLNALSTAEAEFTQVNADGTITTGRLYIQRPGRVRFEYAPPENNLVLAGGGQVAIFDAKSNQPPEQYPLRKTPLSLILDANINLGRARMVVGHSGDDKSTTVTAQDPDHPEYGTIQLIFTGQPTELRQWVITDEAGSETTVILGDLKKGGTLSPRLFSITAEAEKRGKRR